MQNAFKPEVLIQKNTKNDIVNTYAPSPSVDSLFRGSILRYLIFVRKKVS